MSEQQPQERRAKRRAGGINRYTTLGKAVVPEHSEVEILKDQNVPASEHLDTSTLERLDTPTPEVQNAQELRRLTNESDIQFIYLQSYQSG